MNILTPGNKRKGKRVGASVKSQSQPRKVNLAAAGKWLLLLGVAGLCAFGLMTTPKVVESVSSQRVEQVILEGEINFISEQEILAAVNAFISESLLSVDIGEIKEAVEAMPWVRAVNIRREWPDTMVLDVTEEKAIARWGGSKLLNQDGMIFSPASISGLEHLAILSGPEGTERQVMEQYLLFNQLLYQRGLKIAELTQNSRGAWHLMLDSGIEIHVGKAEVMARMRRLVAFAGPEFLDQLVAIESIDLRYASGIAVKNKSLNAEEVVSL